MIEPSFSCIWQYCSSNINATKAQWLEWREREWEWERHCATLNKDSRDGRKMTPRCNQVVAKLGSTGYERSLKRSQRLHGQIRLTLAQISWISLINNSSEVCVGRECRRVAILLRGFCRILSLSRDRPLLWVVVSAAPMWGSLGALANNSHFIELMHNRH